MSSKKKRDQVKRSRSAEGESPLFLSDSTRVKHRTPPFATADGSSLACVRHQAEDVTMCSNALLVAGTYHSVMAGLVWKRMRFYLLFSIRHHVGCMNAVAVSEKYIATSGTDERLFLFTNKGQQRLSSSVREKMRRAGEALPVRLADLGSLTPPSEVYCLAFSTGSQYLLCGCADGQLLVYRTRDWSLVSHLVVHERGLRALAAHPGSGGSLAVSIGDDRAVVVLDVAKGQLLTKWKYTSGPMETPVVATGDEGDVEEGSQADPTKPQGGVFKAQIPGPRMKAREEPRNIAFSPSGAYFCVCSRFSFVVYDTGAMQRLHTWQLDSLQPDEELHTFAFASETTILFGNELGKVLFCKFLKGLPEEQLVLTPLSMDFPTEVASEASALLQTRVQPEVEGRKKHPLRHISRIRALNVFGSTLFSTDASGVVIAWEINYEHAVNSQSLPRLRYVSSANCQGRVTSMSALPL